MKKSKWALPGTLLLLLSVSCGSTSSLSLPAPTAKAGWSEFSSGAVAYGQTYEVPKVSYEENGQTYEATCLLTFPDGTQSFEKKVTLDQAGVYTLSYSVEIDGEVHARTESFAVEYPYYSVKDQSSQILEEIPDYATTEGVMVRLAQGDSLKFTKPISLKDLSTPTWLLKGYVTPDVIGTKDFNVLLLTLTDYEDPSKTVTMRYYTHDSDQQGCSYASACGDGQEFMGMHASQGLHVGDTYGMWAGVSFDGKADSRYADASKGDVIGSPAPVDRSLFTFGFDSSANKVYTTGFGQGTKFEELVDLDDPKQVPHPWSGFVGDKVWMSVSATSYNSATANFVITSAFGMEDVGNNIYIDSDAPDIAFEAPKEAPVGAVGYSYPVPKAKSHDLISGDCAVHTSVYFDYYGSPVSIPVENGRFKTDFPGVYTIVYSAKDQRGNEAKRTLDVNVLPSLSAPEFDLPAHANAIAMGSFVNLPTDIAINGGSGAKTLRIIIEHDGIQENGNAGFRVESFSTHKVTYEVTDVIGQKTAKSYELYPYDAGYPILEGEPVLPLAFVSGAEYEMPLAYAYSVKNRKLVRDKIDYSIGETTVKAGEKLSVRASGQGEEIEVNLSYNKLPLGRRKAKAILPYGTELSPNAINLRNYFLNEGCASSLLEIGMRFASEEGNFTSLFANPVLGKSFLLSLSNVSAPEKGKLSFRLVDAGDHDKTLTFDLARKGDSTYFEVDGKSSLVPGDSFADESNSYDISYVDGSFLCQSTSLAPEHYDDGTPFAGFSSEKVYLEVLGEKIEGYTMVSLGNHVFREDTLTDRIRPVIQLPGEQGGTYHQGDTYTIEPAFAYDVLSPSLDFTFTVTHSKGDGTSEIVKDVDGVPLENADPSLPHTIRFDELGSYSVQYEASESSSFLKKPNKATDGFSLYALDVEAPSLRFLSEPATTAKVGESIYFPEIEVSDNHDPLDEIILLKTVLGPSGTTHYLSGEENGIVASVAGTYVFRVLAFDAYGNRSALSFNVTVTE